MGFILFAVGSLPSQPSFPFALAAAIPFNAKYSSNCFLKEGCGVGPVKLKLSTLWALNSWQFNLLFLFCLLS